MDIDWITVSAQIINFLLLVWLLKRFLYQPVIRAMDRREQRITERLSEAQERESEAEKKASHYKDKSDELEQQRQDILDKARGEAENEKNNMLKKARTEVAETREHWQQQANQEKEDFLENLQRQAVGTVQTIAKKALSELADIELEKHIIHLFVSRLKSQDKKALEALSGSDGSVRIISSFEIDSATRGVLTRAIHEQIDEGVDVDYSQSDELLCGIVLNRGEQRISWNLADFSETLSNRIDEAFSPTEKAKEKE